jgi:hypothetical protein
MRPYVRWTREEEVLLARMCEEGVSVRRMAARLARSVSSVYTQAHRLGLKMQRTKKKMQKDAKTGARSASDLILHLKQYRKATGTSSRDLDDIAGIAPGYTSKVEAGMKGLGPRFLDAVLEALDLEIKLVPRKREDA